jgi:hypothetical protein
VAAKIIHQYVLEDGSTQVNLKSSTVSKMKSQLDDPERLIHLDLFEACLDELFKDLTSRVFVNLWKRHQTIGCDDGGGIYFPIISLYTFKF